MKKLSMLIILVVLVTSCATIPSQSRVKPVVRVEYTFKQNMINLGITLLGAGVQVLGNGYIMRRTEDGIRDGFEGGMRR